LEYAPAHFQQQLETLSSDPIVQLRYVCKKCVIWLRTLYCWSRMLPSQALRGTTIGFSIYVVSEGNDDVSSLVSSQGFLAQGQPSGVLTPYGELAWKVFYAPRKMVERFVPQKMPYKSEARPIPKNSFPEHPVLVRRDSSPATIQSAPQHDGRRGYHRSNSVAAAKAYDPPRSDQKSPANRSNRYDGGAPTMTKDDQNGLPPSKTLSGLSLAMMMSDENVDSTDTDVGTTTTTNDQAEKRRAALHHAPPQLLMNNANDGMAHSYVLKKSLTSAGEYGYAYNNHIPWQQIRPSNNPSTNNRISPYDTARTASPSPATHQGTPPTGFLSGTPPTGGFFGVTPPINPSSLIPPRSAVTPPFVRPLGFVEEPSNQPPSEPLPPAATESATGASAHISTPHPVTSLDLLHSSPFLQPPGASLLSSLSAHDPSNLNSFLSGDLRSQGEAAFHPYEDHYLPHYDEDDDMPFAVDSSPPLGPSGAYNSTSSSHLASSAAVASFAQRCAAANKLALFETVQQQQQQGGPQTQEDLVASLVDQLAEFKSFGASLTAHGKTASDSAGDSGSTSTPISLRI
jgi:hypothetical protein